MTAKKSFPKKALKCTLPVLVLPVVLILLGTWLMNRDPLQQQIRLAVLDRSGGMLSFGHLKLALFPRPALDLTDPVIAVPGKLKITLRAARIYPEVLPLIRGDVRIAKVRLDRPDVIVHLTEEPGAAPEDPRTVFQETRAELESAVNEVRRIGPEFFADVLNGKVTIRGTSQVLAAMDEINGTIGLLPKGFSVKLRGKTSRWGIVSMKGAVLAGRNSIAVRDLSVSGGRSSLSGATARFRWKKTPYLDISSGSAVVFLEDIYERRLWLGLKDRLRDIQSMRGAVRFSQIRFVGPLLHQDRWKLSAAGSLAGIEFQSPLFRNALRLNAGLFSAASRELSFTDLEAALLDSTATGRISLAGSLDRIRAVDVSLRGRFGRELIRWSADRFKVRPDMVPRGPLSVPRLHFTWKEGPVVGLAGKALFGNGTVVTVDLKKDPGRLLIQELIIEDERDRTFLSLDRTATLLAFTFRGVLQEKTVNKILESPSVHQGWVRGDLSARVRFDRPRDSTARGSLSGAGLFFHQGQAEPVTIRQIELQAEGRTATIHAASFLWGATPFEVKGRVNGFAEGFNVDLDLQTGTLSLDRIQRLISGMAAAADAVEAQRSGPRMVQGTIRVTLKELLLGGYVFKPVKAGVFLDRNSVRIQVVESALCGISVPGHLQPFEQDLMFDLQPAAREQPLEPALACLSSNKRISGTFDLTARLHARGRGREGLLRSLEGGVDFSARNGKIYSYPLLARIFAFLNVTELLRGKLPDLGRDGFAYRTIKIRGDIRNGRLLFTEAVLEGATLNLAAEGRIDFAANRIEMTLLVAPFKTIEYILSRIPLIRNILANRLITVPVRVTGDLNDPDIKPLDPKAIGGNLLRIMRSILELPFKVLDPLINPKD